MLKVMIVMGTRPEAIKLAPLILELNKESWAEVTVVTTSQHQEMMHRVLDFFEIKPDIDLNLMKPNQDLCSLTGRMFVEMGKVLREVQPKIVLAQGDTTTVMVTALSCFYERVKFGHVEAGLRTGDILSPFPEEVNRLIAAPLSYWNFAPTERAKENLLKEFITSDRVFVTGNTGIDALFIASKQSRPFNSNFESRKRLILVTMHRRENQGKPLENVCKAIIKLATDNNDIQVLFPMHPSPTVRSYVENNLSGFENIILCEPLDYGEFVSAMTNSFLILSDSGGIQEEAPTLGIPLLVLRNETERPEAIATPSVKLVGCSEGEVFEQVSRLLHNKLAYERMAQKTFPFGDGSAAKRIVNILKRDQ